MERSNYPNIPLDFPIEPTDSALSGTHLKLSLVEENGKYYSPGSLPGEVADAHDVYEGLAQQMVPYCTRKMVELGLPLEEIRDKLLIGIHQKNCVIPAPAR